MKNCDIIITIYKMKKLRAYRAIGMCAAFFVKEQNKKNLNEIFMPEESY